MSKKITYTYIENDNKILSSNEVKLYNLPKPEEMKIIIWGKELCNVAEWKDFLKCVEEKTEENNKLKQQLTEKDKEIEYLNHKIDIEEPCLVRNYKDMIEQLKQSQTQLAIQELEKIKDYFILEHEDGSLDITKNEFEIAEYLIKKIKELKGEI